MKKLKDRPQLRLVVVCYALGLALWLLWQLGGFVANRVAYATGGLVQQAVSMDDFEWVDIVERDGAYVTTSADPQLLLKDTGRRVESVTLEIRYDRSPYMVTAYWAAPGQDYALKKIAYGSQQKGSWRIWLPAAGGQSLRVDPDAQAGTTFWVERIVLNPGRPFYAFFIPSAGQAALWCVVPGLVAAGLSTLKEAGIWPKRRAKGGGAP